MSFFSFSPELEHTVWIKPRRRTTFLFPVPATDGIDTEIALTCTVPGPLVESRLVKAFEDSLTCYPHASGRPGRRGDSWAIGHGARGVPLTFITTDEPFNHYEYLNLPPSRVVDCLGESPDAQWDAPLLRVRVTFCRTTNETTIGWSSSRTIGNAEFVYAFMSSLSQHYQHKLHSSPLLDHTPSSSFTRPILDLSATALAADEEYQLHNAILEAVMPTPAHTRHTHQISTLGAIPRGRNSTTKTKINLGSKWHFGYGAERTRVVLYGDNAEVGYERYFTAPPVKLRDGSWDSNDSEKGVPGPGSMKETEPVDTEEEEEVAEFFPRRNASWRESEVRARGREGERAKL